MDWRSWCHLCNNVWRAVSLLFCWHWLFGWLAFWLFGWMVDILIFIRGFPVHLLLASFSFVIASRSCSELVGARYWILETLLNFFSQPSHSRLSHSQHNMLRLLSTAAADFWNKIPFRVFTRNPYWRAHVDPRARFQTIKGKNPKINQIIKWWISDVGSFSISLNQNCNLTNGNLSKRQKSATMS